MDNKFIQIGVQDSTFGDYAQIEINQTIHVPRVSSPIPSDERSGSPNFVGRVQDLRDLHQALQQEDVVAVCAVRGMGGIGKTELAIQYAQSSLAKESYIAYYWFALNRGSLAGQVLDKAMPYLAMPEEVLKSPSLERQVQWCWQNWWPTEGQVLVIIDDVQGLPDIPSHFLPMGSRFKVLLTTRQRNLSPSFRELALGVLSEDESLQLLQKIVDKAGTARVTAEGETAKAICRAVGYLPLALELAATFLLDDPLLSLADYLAQLHLLDESLSDEMVRGITAERGVIAAFTLSWQRLSEEAQGLAMLLGQFGAAEIPADYWLEPTVAVLGWVKAAMVAARKLLTNLSLIEITAARSIALHPLLRQYYRYQAGQRGAAFIAELHWGIVTRGIEIAETIPKDPVKADIERVGLTIPHLEEMEREMIGAIANPEEDLIWAFLGAAWFYEGQAKYSLAEDFYQRCLTTLESQLGTDHLAVASSLNNLAALYESQGRYSEAEPLFLRSQSIRESQLGADHPDVATSLNHLAGLYTSQGRYSEAEPLYLRISMDQGKSTGSRPSRCRQQSQQLSPTVRIARTLQRSRTPLFTIAIDQGKPTESRPSRCRQQSQQLSRTVLLARTIQRSRTPLFAIAIHPRKPTGSRPSRCCRQSQQLSRTVRIARTLQRSRTPLFASIGDLRTIPRFSSSQHRRLP